MKTQEKADVSYSKKRTFRAMAVPAPEKHGAAHDNRGFTLVELLMVIAIIGVLSLMAIPQYSNLKNFANNSRCKSEIRTVEKSIIAYNLDHGSYPPGPLDATVTTTLKDPWGRDYQYYNIQLNGAGGAYKDPATNDINTDFDLYSMGINGLGTHNLNDPDCIDDIIRAADGSIVEEGKDF